MVLAMCGGVVRYLWFNLRFGGFMEQKVEVLQSDKKSGVGKKSGAAYAMEILQAVLHNDDGSVAAGELMLPKDHPAVAKGFYRASLKLVKSFDGKLVGVVDKLTLILPDTPSPVGKK